MSGKPPVGGPFNPLLVRLRRATAMSAAELEAMGGLSGSGRHVEKRVDLVSEDTRSDHIHVLLGGWACRYKLLANGRRQITGVVLPGDVCDFDGLYVRPVDFTVRTLTSCTVMTISCSALHALAAEHRGVAQALGWLAATENAMLNEYNVGLGQRSAHERLSHLLCELYVRLQAVGLVTDYGFVLPMTQRDIGDALGLTAVHVNRVMQDLRDEGLIQLQRGKAVITQWPRLRAAAGFDPGYLHLGGANRPPGFPEPAGASPPPAGSRPGR